MLLSLHNNNSVLHKSEATFCLSTLRHPSRPPPPSLNFHTYPTSLIPNLLLNPSPCENINKHCVVIVGSLRTQHPLPPLFAERWPPPGGGSHWAAAVVSEAWVTGCWREASLGAAAGNRTWKERVLKALMFHRPSLPPSLVLGKGGHTPTHPPPKKTSLSNKWQGLGVSAHFLGVSNNSERETEEGTYQRLWQFVGDHGRSGSDGGGGVGG